MARLVEESLRRDYAGQRPCGPCVLAITIAECSCQIRATYDGHKSEALCSRLGVSKSIVPDTYEFHASLRCSALETKASGC